MSFNKNIISVLSEDVSITSAIMTCNALSEADKTSISNEVIDSLYRRAIKKYESIYFEDIPESKGDITKVKAYPDLRDTVKLLKSLSFGDKHMNERVNELDLAIDNMIKLKDSFVIGFKVEKATPILIYNTMTMAVVEYASILLSANIKYVSAFNLTGSDTIEIDTNSNYFKTYEQNIYKFNRSYANGHISKVIDYSIKDNSSALMGTIASGSIIMISLFTVLPIMKELIYQFFYQKEKLSKWCKLQSAMLEINISNNSKDIMTYDTVKKQKKLADQFIKLGNMLSMDAENASIRSHKSSKRDDLTLDDLKASQDIDFTQIK